MQLDDVGEAIATRVLHLHGEGETREAVVIIGKPRPFADSSGYYCPFQIRGLGSEKVKWAAGVDAVQAIELVMKAIGAELHVLNELHNGRLRWEADDTGDLGFPMPT